MTCCAKCCNGSSGKKGLCPVSFGLALGITSALAVFLWSVWVMYYGMPPSMAAMNMPVPTWSSSGLHALLAFVKGLVFGFVLILLYDMFSCCFGRKCCKNSDGTTTCGCGKPPVRPGDIR